MKTRIPQAIALIAGIMLWAGTAQAQMIEVIAGSPTTCPGDTQVVVPVTTTNFNGVAGLSLTMLIDTNIIKFQDYVNVHPGLAGGTLLINSPAPGTTVKIAWFSLMAVNLGNAKILDLRFKFKGGTGNLTWSTLPGDCDIDDANGLDLPAVYLPGTITPAPPAIVTASPVPVTTDEFLNTGFSCTATGASQYQWQVSNNGGVTYTNVANNATYGGATTTNLSITNVPYAFNGNLYRCIALNPCGLADTTAPALLTVIEVCIPPVAYQVTGGGSYCAGGAGIPVGVSQSDTGVHYQLWLDGVYTGQSVAGTGSPIGFGLQTQAGTYTILGIKPCDSTMMLGNAVIVVNALPFAYSVTGGGNVCTGDAGVPVGLEHSDLGITYILMHEGNATGDTLTGTGAALSFGNQAMAGTYTIKGISGAGCMNIMDGSETITVNPLPIPYSVSGGGGYCTGLPGVQINLTNSQNGVDYELILDGSPTGIVLSGNGQPLTFTGVMAAGTYTIQGVITVTSCSNMMLGSVTVEVYPLPTVTFTAVPPFCFNDAPAVINTGSPSGGIFSGNGISGGNMFDPAQAGVGIHNITYTYSDSNGCVETAIQSIDVVPSPAIFTVTGGGTYCPTDPAPIIGLDGSEVGGTYELYTGGNMVASVLGTGSAISFGPQPIAGAYTVKANFYAIAPLCVEWMNGTATIAVLPLEAPIAATNQVSAITTQSASFEGSVDVGCGNPITQRGFVLADHAMPTLADVILPDAVAGSGTFTLSASGLLEGITYYVRAFATNTEGTTYGNELSFTTLITPSFLNIAMEESTDKVNWNLVGGSLASGFNLTLNPNATYHYLNFNQAGTASNITLAQPGYFGFTVASYPAGFFAYWDGRGVNAAAAPGTWQSVMWQIINGNLPTFLVKVNTDGSLMLVDGLMYALGQPDDYLRVNWDYLLGQYTYTGTITGANGVVSAPISVDITFNGMVPQFTQLSLENSTDKVSWSPVSGNLNLGFSLLIDSTVAYYYLNFENPETQVNIPLLNAYHPFYVTSYPAGFFAYWDGRGVNAAAVPGTWEAVMWQIINGNQPMFFMKPLPGGGYMLVDGLLHLLGQPDEYLRINGAYLPGDYGFTGTLTGINNIASAPVNVHMTLTRACIPVVILTQPANTSVCVGSATSLQVIASGSAPIHYQWQFNGVNILGANGATLHIPVADMSHAGSYSCEVTNDCGNVTSISATLTVNPLPIITMQPQLAIVNQGATAHFMVTAQYATAYQWQVSTNGGNTWTNISNGAIYAGTTTDHLSVLNTGLSMNGYYYRCIASGICAPAATSNGGLLLVTLPAGTITTTAVSQTAMPGDTVVVPVMVENFYGISAIALTMTYNPVVATFLEYRNPSPQIAGAPILVNAIGGEVRMQWFSIIPANIGNSKLIDFAFIYHGGYTSLNWKLTPKEASEYGDLNGASVPAIWINGSINGASAITITSQPANTMSCIGSPAGFQVTATGATTYAWQVSPDHGVTWSNLVNNAVYSGVSTTMLQIQAVTPGMNNLVYRCVLGDGVQQVISNGAVLTVMPWAYINYTIAANPGLTVCSGTPVTFSLPGDTMLTAPAYSWYLNGVAVSSAPTYTLAVPVDGDQVSVSVIALANCAATNIQAVDVIVDPMPVITTHPINVTAYELDTVSFQVVSPSNVAYQWQVSTNGGLSWMDVTNLPPYVGATSSTLTINGLNLSQHNYQYRVKLTENQCGQILFSNAAILTVKQLPVYTYLGNLTACAGDLIAVPVTAENFNHIASASLRFTFDTTVLSFAGFQNMDPGFNNGFLFVNQFGDQISISYFGMPAISIGNGLLFEVLFTYHGGTSALVWDPTFGFTMYTNQAGQTLEAYFIDGQVSSKPLPVVYQVTGGGQYCIGGTGVSVGLDNSESGINYELFLNGNPTGQIVAGTGLPVSFGNQLLAGTYTVFATNATTGCVNDMAGNAVVIINPLPVVTMTLVQDEACVDALPVTLDGGAPAGGTYSYMGNNITAFDPATGAGTYTITYTFTDSNGCTASASDDFTVHPLPVVSITPALSSICFGDSTILTASGASTYLWSTGETTAAITVHPAVQTTYSVTGTSIHGCVSNAQATVDVHPLPVVTISPVAPVICDGDLITLVAHGATTYSWSNGVNADSITVAPSLTTTYHVTGTDGFGCQGAASVIVTVNPLPLVVVNPSPATICEGESVELVASGALSYAWNHGALTDTIVVSPMVTTSYTVSGTDINGCVNTTSVTVFVDPLPLVYSVTGGGPYCANGTGVPVGLANSEAGVDYTLYIDGMATIQVVSGTGSAITFGNQTVAGNYTVHALNTATTCHTMMGGSVSVSIDPLPIVIQQPLDVTLNIGFTAVFSALMSPVASYQWEVSMDGGLSWITLADGGMYQGSATANLSVGPVPFSANGYLFRVLGQNGTCAVYSNAAQLTVNPVIPTLTTSLPDVLACPGDTVIIPVSVTNANFINGFDLSVSFDPTVLQLVGSQNLHPDLANGMLVVLPGASNLQVQWNAAMPVFMGNATLAELVFHYTGGSSNLNWAAGSFYLNGFADTIPAAYVNGSVNQASAPPVITASPVSVNLIEGNNTTFAITATGATSFVWEVSADGGVSWSQVVNGTHYAGAATATLQILNAPLSFNGNLYRGIAIEGVCGLSATSSAAGLTVYPSGLSVITSLTTKTQCPGTVLHIPVTVQNFLNVSSASLKIAYDTNVLVYTGYHAAHPQLASGTLMLNQLGAELGIGWFTVFPAWILNDTLMVLEFNYLGGNTALTFNTTTFGACQYTDLNGVVLPAVFNNGAANQLSYPPVITNQPQDQYVLVGSNPGFSITGTGISSIQWQISTDNGLSWTDLSNNAIYSGVTTNMLTITNALLGMDGHLFRAILTENTCNLTTTSNPALLNVVPFNPVVITSVPTLVTCPDTLIIPVTVQNVYNVYSISLMLGYDTTNLQFLGFSNPHPQIGTGFLSASALGGKVGISWFSMSPANILNGKLMDLKFVFTGNSSALTWDLLVPGNCQYTDLAGVPYPAQYNHGSVTTLGPSLITQPMDVLADAGTSAIFQVTANLATGYQWQVSSNNGLTWTDLTNTAPYSGVTTGTLTVNPLTLAMSGHMFRAVISGTCAPVTSGTALLTVKPPLAQITTYVGTYSSCAGNISIPVRVNNFINVASMNLALWINTDSLVLNYTGYTNAAASLVSGGALSVTNQGDSLIRIMWTATSAGVTFGGDTLLVLQFTSTGGNTNLRWDTQTPGACNYVDPLGYNFPQYYQNGSIVVHELPVAAAVPAGPVTLCAGGSPSVYTIPAVSYATAYTWALTPANAGTVMPSGTTASIVWNAGFTGTANLTVRGVNSCGNGPLSPALAITVNATPGQAAAPVGPVTLCINSSNSTYTTAGAANAATYQWAVNPVNAGTITGTGTTATIDWNNTYSGFAVITVKGINACGEGLFSNGLLVTIHPNPVVNLGPDVIVCASQTVILNAGISGATYLWSTGATSQWISIDSTGYGIGTHTFSVTVTNSNGCSGSDAVNVTFDPCVDIAENEQEVQLEIYPNPNQGQFTVNIDGMLGQGATLQVLNLLGAQVYEYKQLAPDQAQTIRIELEQVPAGIYLLRLQHHDKMLIRKVVIQH